MKILALGAHPDDIEYGCGGTLLQAAAKGHEIYLGVMTDGGSTESINRVSEQENAAEHLGAKDLYWGGFQDTELKADRSLIVAVEDMLSKAQPDMVFVNHPDDAHQDHQALASSTVTACRYIKRVLFYHDYTALNFQPDTFVDIGNMLDKKCSLLSCHGSQVGKTYPTGLDLLESVHSIASYYGFMAKVKYAEGFKPLRNLMNICD